MDHPNYPGTSNRGRSACGWWFPHRDEPGLSKPGQVSVSLGSTIGYCDESDTTAQRWCVNFIAVVDDFGTLRRVAS